MPARRVTYSMGLSADGYIVGPDGRFDWTAPDAEVFQFAIDEIRNVGVHLLGRRLYETMLYWETADEDPGLDDAMLEWTALWKALPKVVFSTTLSSVQGNARLAGAGLAEEIARLRAEPGEGDIAIGGAALAAHAAELGLIDEYRPKIYPVLVGGGTPFFPRPRAQVELELVETRTFRSGVVYLRQRVVRDRTDDGVVIRRVTLSDLDVYREVRLRALRDSPSAFGSTYEAEVALSAERWQERLSGAASGSERAMFLAFDGTDCVGLAGCVDDDLGADRQLISMWVAPSHRGTDVATGLVDMVVRWAEEAGARHIGLWVTRGNDRAQRFYERAGFRVTGDVQPLPSDPCKDEIRMVRALPAVAMPGESVL